ncbi:unnamed protein product, partial [Didymodactylos carnosus]
IVDFIDDASESATNVHKNAREVLKKHHLNVQNLTTIGVDNTNVNVGEQHSVYKLFRDEFSDLIKGSCYNHILYNSVKQAHKLLTIDVEKILLSIYAHFSRSAKRIEELKTYYEFYEQDYLKTSLQLQRSYTTAVDLHRLITSLKFELQQRLDSSFFGSVPSHLFDAISPFGSPEIDRLTWQQVIECTERLKLKTLNEDQLFDEFNGIQLTFKATKDKKIPLYDQIQAFISQKTGPQNTEMKTISSSSSSSSSQKSVFSQMKYLVDDRRNRMSTELISAELKIRLNAQISCSDIYSYSLSKPDLLKSVHSVEKYSFKKQRVE